MAIKIHPSVHVHPGPWLKRQFVEPYAVNVKALAAHFGVSRQALSNLLHGHAALTADMAIRFEKAFGVKADTLMRMQTAYELAQARAHEGDIHVARLEMAA
ncbi:MAG: HigA family addiction module antitoxin [Candidatus Sphingomonas colombiensis]|nr:HigA family addiction module antitoxin [Sphingomonas sp.]WEK42987.1 MAG: HigA family addiction module antitoxin [Sphingomonas sp.]